MATALGAALRGFEVTVFEASPLLGGAAAYSGGQVWIGANHVAVWEGIADDPAWVESYVRGIAHRHPELLDETALQRWLAAGPEAIRYWEQVGAVTWEVMDGFADYHGEVIGALDNGRYLTGSPIARSELGPWIDKSTRAPTSSRAPPTRTSPTRAAAPRSPAMIPRARS